MTDPSFAGQPVFRRTPDSRRIRQAALALFSAGLYVGFAGSLLPLVAAHFTLGATMAERWQYSLLAGGLAGMLGGRLLARMSTGVRGVTFAGAGATLAAFASLATSHGVSSLPIIAVLLGLGLGLAAIAASYALDGALAAGSAFGTLDLAAACFGVGALGGCGLLVFFSMLMEFGQVPVAAGSVLLIAAILVAWLSVPPDAVPPTVLAHRWHDLVRPTRVLLSIGLMLQAALWGAMAFWLGFYGSRSLGVNSSWAVGLLAIFWLGWVTGRTISVRAASVGVMKAGLMAAVAGTLACLFLANTADLEGAVVGALLLGLASGTLQGLVQFTAGRDEATLAMVARFFVGSVMSALLSAAVAGSVIRLMGARALIWIVAALGLILVMSLVVFVVESRLARNPAEA